MKPEATSQDAPKARCYGTRILGRFELEMETFLLEKLRGSISKLIYDLADQGGELCSLRYDPLSCDFDIAGDETIGADFEVVRILTELLDELNIGEYEIKLNHRKLLDGGLPEGGLPEGGLPGGGLPEGGLPEGGLPGSGLLEGGLPSGGMPKGGLPEGGLPGVGLPEGGLPGGGLPK
ncbi:histidine--tRNA ligase, cytoplasmic [Tanacetum coccineum]